MLTAITGASGHVGINLTRALISRGRQVRVLSHTSNLGLEGLPVEYCRGDVADIDTLVAAFSGVRVVYHLAAHISLSMNDWPRCAQVNIEGTRNVIEACRRSRVQRLVHFSTIHTLRSEPLDTPIDESRPYVSSPDAPPYDRSKAAGEKLVRRAVDEGLDAVIINPTGVIGPFDYRPSHFGQALILIASGKMPVLIEGGFDWVDARDVAECAIKAEETAAAGLEIPAVRPLAVHARYSHHSRRDYGQQGSFPGLPHGAGQGLRSYYNCSFGINRYQADLHRRFPECAGQQPQYQPRTRPRQNSAMPRVRSVKR